MTSSTSVRKVALVTGAARRVGASIVEFLHGCGLNVILHCNGSRQEATELCTRLNDARPDSAVVLQADLMQPSACSQFVDATLRAWGRLDALVNNASRFYPTPVAEIKDEDWEQMLGIHIKVPFSLARQFHPALKEQRGCIVNICDIHTDRPLKDFLAYSVSKAGLVTLTKALARELAPQVRCNAVAPGAILWPEQDYHASKHQDIINRTALKREGNPKDVAAAVYFLIESADYMTGQVLVVDGGRTLSN